MSEPFLLTQREVTLLELVDRVLNKGVVLTGDITLSVAGVDLVYVGLRVLLASVATLEEREIRGQ
jgi:gas vesicle structural protein